MIYKQYEYWGVCTEQVKSVLGALYARYIVSAMERNCYPRSGMNHRDRKGFVKKLFMDTLFLDLVPFGKSQDSKALSVALSILKSKNTAILLCFGRGVYFCKRKLPIFFTKVRSKR